MCAALVLTLDTARVLEVCAAAAHLLDLPPELRHPQAQQPLVYFYLLFSHAARLSTGLPFHCAAPHTHSAPICCGYGLRQEWKTAGAAAAGVRTVRPHARQPGQLVIELRQVHLAHTRHSTTDAHLYSVQRVLSGPS